MDLYIYDRQDGLQGVLDAVTSIRWRRKYFEPGEVEIHLPATKENMELLTEDRIIRRTDRVETAIIEGVEIDGEDMAVTGRMLSSILERAILSKQYNLKGTTEKAMLALIPEGTRVVPELTAAEEGGAGGPQVDLQATYKNLLTVEERLAKASGLGFRIRYDGRKMTFEVYQGQDRTVRQRDRPVVIFSDEFGNLAAPKYTRTTSGWKNKAYVAGAGEGADRAMEVVDLSDGVDVRELYVDARDLQREEGTGEDEYKALLHQRGLEKLAECARVESFEGNGEDVENFAYMVDWDLGDIVTIQYARLGITMHERITEVEEVFERGVATYTPVFGSPLPEKLDLGDATE